MTDFIDSVVTLIDVRDRDDLELTLASVMFELAGATALILWRVDRRDGEIELTERLHLSSGSETLVPSSPALGLGGEPLSRMSEELRTAFETQQYFYGGHRGGAASRHVFPIVDAGEVVCLLEIDRDSPLGKEQERLVFGLLKIYRSHLGILENTDTDELTGLSNRRPFDEAFRRLANSPPPKSRAHTPERRADPPPPRAELAVVDIDFFKRINDSFGHPYGDEVLVLLARIMRNCFRDSDRMFRFGGEEFVIILAGVDPQQAETALERFRSAVETFAFPQVGHVTVSVGVTSIRSGETGSDAFGRADAALYFAKRLGRNQTRRHETLVSKGLIEPKDRVAQDIEMF